MDPRTPVLAGAGVAHQRLEDASRALDAVDLMTAACERAAPRSLLAAADVVLVPRGTWRDRDPGRVMAEHVGATPRTVVSEIGVLQQTLVTRACDAIARGDVEIAIVMGGEARYRDLRARLDMVELPGIAAEAAEPDEVMAPDSEILPRAEIDGRLTLPAAQYAVIETARRAARGESVGAYADALAGRWAAFSEVAAQNPDAWRREAVAPAFLAVPSDANPMYCAPYTKWHCSQWNVDQAAALVLCSVDAARRYGVDPDAWVFPQGAVESNAMVPLSRRDPLHHSPAVRVGDDVLTELTGIRPRDADHLELYSCFPSAVQVQADELRLDDARVPTVTGGMTFAGGPLNNANLQALVKMAEVLREHPGTVGLITCISGMITKHGMALWSSEPPRNGFRSADISDETMRQSVVRELSPAHDGTARVDGYTVVHSRDGEPERAIIVATTDDGRRCVAASSDAALAAAMTTEEWVGRAVDVTGAEFRVSRAR
jgi:acetyl-CoA C-acetyltransferase